MTEGVPKAVVGRAPTPPRPFKVTYLLLCFACRRVAAGRRYKRTQPLHGSRASHSSCSP